MSLTPKSTTSDSRNDKYIKNLNWQLKKADARLKYRRSLKNFSDDNIITHGDYLVFFYEDIRDEIAHLKRGGSPRDEYLSFYSEELLDEDQRFEALLSPVFRRFSFNEYQELIKSE